MDLIEVLDERQLEAVTTSSKHTLVLAAAGSGKTRVLTYRIAHLIDEGIEPRNMMAVTFTNKAADEIKERIERLIGSHAAAIWAGTFHSICAKILRRHWPEELDFTIIDDSDSRRIVREVIHNLDKDKEHKASIAASHISRYKADLISPAECTRQASNRYEHSIAEIYREYDEYCQRINVLDFDDLIMRTVMLFRDNPELCSRYQQRFAHVLVDEYQDVNTAQHELTRILTGDGSVFAVGDDFQCLLPSTPVRTINGNKEIKDITEDTDLLVASGHGTTTVAKPDKVMSKQYSGPMITITTESGRVISGTPEHCMFARFDPNPSLHFVYLMYDRKLGYRIGRTSGVRMGKTGVVNGYKARLTQEGADALWILKTCNSLEVAVYWESYYSIEYGIPNYVFKAKGRDGIALSQQSIDSLFLSIDTRKNAARLMEDLMLDPSVPHHVPQATTRMGRESKKLNFVMFGSKRSDYNYSHPHELSFSTIHDSYAKAAAKYINVNRKKATNSGTRYWNGRLTTRDYDKCWNKINHIRGVVEDLSVEINTKLTDKKYSFMPLSHIREGMHVPVESNGHITEERVIATRVQNYHGLVYDISIPSYRNFIADGIVVHNSIYMFRGSEMSHIINFNNDYSDVQIFTMDQSYRCTKNIVAAANNVIAQNTNQHAKDLWSNRKNGGPIHLSKAQNVYAEAEGVRRQVNDLLSSGHNYRDIAILYRTRIQSEPIEYELNRAGIPCVVLSSLKFYDRMEIKDIAAYVSAIFAPDDDTAIGRIINVPRRGIGNITVNKLKALARRNRVSLYQAMRMRDDTDIDPQANRKVGEFLELMDRMISQSYRTPYELVNLVLNSTGYEEHLHRFHDASNRRTNIEQLKNIAIEYSEVEDFLDRFRLATDAEIPNAEKDAVKLMTCHAAKGLEFKIVFVVGLDDKLFPHHNAKDNAEVEEERRLFYVAITRAKDELYLSYSTTRGKGRTLSATRPSRFLRDIPQSLITSK